MKKKKSSISEAFFIHRPGQLTSWITVAIHMECVVVAH